MSIRLSAERLSFKYYIVGYLLDLYSIIHLTMHRVQCLYLFFMETHYYAISNNFIGNIINTKVRN